MKKKLLLLIVITMIILTSGCTAKNGDSVKRDVILESYTFGGKIENLSGKSIVIKINNKIIYNDQLHSKNEGDSNKIMLDIISGETKGQRIPNVVMVNENGVVPVEIDFDSNKYKYNIKYSNVSSIFYRKMNISLKFEDNKLLQIERGFQGFDAN